MDARSTLPLLIATLLLLPLATADETDASTYTAVGESLPEFEFTTLDGRRITNESLNGNVVVLNFFATWCGPCQTELPHLEEEVWKLYRGDGFELFVIGREHTAAELNTFRKETEFTFPLAADPKRKTYGLFAEKWIPRTYVIGSDGSILYQSKGYEAEEFAQMIAVIEDALKTNAEAAKVQDHAATPQKSTNSKSLKSVTVSGETRIRVQHREN